MHNDWGRWMSLHRMHHFGQAKFLLAKESSLPSDFFFSLFYQEQTDWSVQFLSPNLDLFGVVPSLKWCHRSCLEMVIQNPENYPCASFVKTVVLTIRTAYYLSVLIFFYFAWSIDWAQQIPYNNQTSNVLCVWKWNVGFSYHHFPAKHPLKSCIWAEKLCTAN